MVTKNSLMFPPGISATTPKDLTPFPGFPDPDGFYALNLPKKPRSQTLYVIMQA